jgi:Tfp pilus assembly protein PilF
MKPEDPLRFRDAPPPELVALTLARIEGSSAFRGSRRHRDLLRYLVERTQAGEHATLKESVLAVEVFGRAAARFDPRSDSIVRVETRRLRKRLDAFFRGEGRASPLRIELPVGSYVPVIAPREVDEERFESTRRARDLVERGEHFLRQPLSQQTLEEALGRFNAALRESPDFVPALVGAARAWLNLATGWYHDPAVAGEHAAEALRRALERDADNAVAHALLGAIENLFEHNWPAARRSFQRAIALAPDHAFVHGAWGYHLLAHGDFDAAERELTRARQLDPQYINARMHMINLRIGQGRLADAQAELDAMCDIAPGSMPAAALGALLALCRGETGAAVEQFRRACALAPGHAACEISLASALAFAGRHEEADALAQAVRNRGERVSPYVWAIFETRRGRPDHAFERLIEAIDANDPNLIVAAGDVSLAPLHADPRWAAFIVAMRRPRGRDD